MSRSEGRHQVPVEAGLAIAQNAIDALTRDDVAPLTDRQLEAMDELFRLFARLFESDEPISGDTHTLLAQTFA